jgi:hypothetical protein
MGLNMLLNLGVWEWTAIGAGAAFVLAMLIIIPVVRRNKVRSKKNLVETRNARFTYETGTTTQAGDAKVSFTREDVLIPMGTTLRAAAKGGDLKPGKYIILCTDDKTPKFNMRIGSYVHEYKHNQEVVIGEGMEVTAISKSVILR